MPVSQVDHFENGDTARVFFRRESGSLRGLWRLERFVAPDPLSDVREPGWLLSRFRLDGGAPLNEWFLPTAPPQPGSDFVLLDATAGVVGWRQARAMLRRFGVYVGSEKPTNLPPNRPRLRLVPGRRGVVMPRQLPPPFRVARGDLKRASESRRCRAFARADARIRTADPFITSEVLYQLSYVGRGGTV